MIVVDASAVVDALSGAPDSDDLRSRLAGEELHAPALVDYEAVSALRGLVLGGRLSPGRAGDLLADLDDLRMTRWPASDPLRRRTFELRSALSAYDAAYVALAEALDSPLVTRDDRLARSAGHSARIEAL